MAAQKIATLALPPPRPGQCFQLWKTGAGRDILFMGYSPQDPITHIELLQDTSCNDFQSYQLVVHSATSSQPISVNNHRNLSLRYTLDAEHPLLKLLQRINAPSLPLGDARKLTLHQTLQFLHSHLPPYLIPLLSNWTHTLDLSTELQWFTPLSRPQISATFCASYPLQHPENGHSTKIVLMDGHDKPDYDQLLNPNFARITESLLLQTFLQHYAPSAWVPCYLHYENSASDTHHYVPLSSLPSLQLSDHLLCNPHYGLLFNPNRCPSLYTTPNNGTDIDPLFVPLHSLLDDMPDVPTLPQFNEALQYAQTRLTEATTQNFRSDTLC